MDCGSLLPLSARQPAVSGGGLGSIVRVVMRANADRGSQQAALPRATAGCSSPRRLRPTLTFRSGTNFILTMPAKLFIPENPECSETLGSGFRITALPWHSKESMAIAQRNREALMLTVLICTTLWGGFWFQFVISILYNIPALHTLSGGNWYDPSLEFYMYQAGPFPCSLAWVFGGLSMFAASIALVGAWVFTIGIDGKWRMRFTVTLFSILIVGWSLAGVTAEDASLRGLEKDIAVAREQWRLSGDSGDEWEVRFWRNQVEGMEALLKTREELAD